MNIHCSACGSPLPSGAKFCPACALPLTAIAMPTPAPVRRQKPIWPYVLLALFILYMVMYTSDQVSRQHEAEAKAAEAAMPHADFGIDQGLEHRMEAHEWFDARGMRNWREQVAKNLSEAQRRKSEPGAQQVIDNDAAAVQRIDARLKELHAQ